VKRVKLPVPAPWQPAVCAALQDHVTRTGLPEESVTVTYVAPLSWRAGEGRDGVGPSGPEQHGLSIWLLARGRTVKYRADLVAGTVGREADAR
jgi:hypothetical protein